MKEMSLMHRVMTLMFGTQAFESIKYYNSKEVDAEAEDGEIMQYEGTDGSDGRRSRCR